MRKSRFSEEQIINVLKEQQAGVPVPDLCRKHGISDATFYTGRTKYGGMEMSDARRLKAVEEENRKLAQGAPRVLGVSKAGYYAWLQRPPSAHAMADTALLKRVKTIHASSRQTYGAPRIHAELRGRGERHGRKRIARLMREAGLIGASHRCGGPITTRRDKHARPAPDLVDCNFSAAGPNQLWVADITYVPTAAGFLYLAVVLDAWSRKIVGWSMANHLRTELVLDAMAMAVGQRRPKDVIHHSDQGSQYTSVAFGKRCGEAGVRPSMGSVGDAYDNAMAESFFSTLEAELLSRRRFASQAEAKMACFTYIEGWYNPARLHSGLGYRSPITYETDMQPTMTDN